MATSRDAEKEKSLSKKSKKQSNSGSAIPGEQAKAETTEDLAADNNETSKTPETKQQENDAAAPEATVTSTEAEADPTAKATAGSSEDSSPEAPVDSNTEASPTAESAPGEPLSAGSESVSKSQAESLSASTADTAAEKATNSEPTTTPVTVIEAAESSPKAQEPLSEPVTGSDTGVPNQAHGKIFSEVLEKSIPEVEGRSYRHPMFIDALLAAGLLVAVGGITLGLIKLYITQEAKLDINQRHYAQAINVLEGAPLPGWFSMRDDQDDSPEELLNKAYYLDAMEKLDANKKDTTAIKELEKIPPGSKFHAMANEYLDLSAPRSAITLEGNVEHEASATESNSPEAKPLIPASDENR